jgi:hypothetical protein
MLNKQLILIGEAENYFDEYCELLMKGVFKFLLINDKDRVPQILLMIKGKPFDLHAQALLQHMQDSGLTDIEVHGGGDLHFFDNGSISASELSDAFKSVIPEELIECSRQIWPSKKMYTTDVDYLSNADFGKYHRLYSLDEVIAEAKKVA